MVKSIYSVQYSSNYNSILNRLNFTTLYYLGYYLDALFLLNISQDKINCCSITDTDSLHVFTKQIWCFSTFYVSNIQDGLWMSMPAQA